MNPIEILGGGIAGLTVAIHLKITGRDVEVHERKTFCGKTSNDLQFLENWTFDADAIEFLKRSKINLNFYIKPWYAQ